MPSISPSQGVALWFTYLRDFQAACNSTTAAQMDLLTFADTSVTAILPSAQEQNTFLTNIAVSPGISGIPISALAGVSFEGLLDNSNPLVTYVAVLLQSLSDPSLQNAASADYWSALVSAAFPGGSKGAPWTVAMGSLTSVIPAVCFTATLQAAVNKTVDKATSKVSDLIPQIARLG